MHFLFLKSFWWILKITIFQVKNLCCNQSINLTFIQHCWPITTFQGYVFFSTKKLTTPLASAERLGLNFPARGPVCQTKRSPQHDGRPPRVAWLGFFFFRLWKRVRDWAAHTVTQKHTPLDPFFFWFGKVRKRQQNRTMRLRWIEECVKIIYITKLFRCTWKTYECKGQMCAWINTTNTWQTSGF